MLSAFWGLGMRGFGRVVAAVLLTGAVAGTAAFAHLLGSEPAAPFSVAALPPAPAAPLVVRADPWSPVPASLGAAIARPAGLPAPVVTLTPPALQRPKTPSIHQLKSIVRITPVAPRAKITAEPTPAAAPVAAAPTVATPAAPATPTVAAAPVAAPTVPNRGLTTATTPAPVTPAPATTTAPATPKHQRGEHTGRDRDKNQHGGESGSGNSSSGDSSPVILSATPVAAPQPVATPQPVVTAPLPSVDPPAPTSTWSHATTDAVTSSPHGHNAGVDSDGAGS